MSVSILRVVSVVLDTLENGGYRAVTIDGIARQVGRARTSLYRRWPSKASLVAYAAVGEMGDKPAADTGSLRGDLQGAAHLDRARLRAEARSGLDVELVLDVLTGPFYYRTLFGPAQATSEMTRRVVDYTLRLVAPQVTGNRTARNSRGHIVHDSDDGSCREAALI